MLNYRRDGLWDAAAWADIDQAVLDEVQRVRVARKVFHTEDLSTATGGPPSWVSNAQVTYIGPSNARHIPEQLGRPFAEISVPFQLTQAQVDAESALHTARTLARTSASALALSEDWIVFRGSAAVLPRGTFATNYRPGPIGVYLRGRLEVVAAGANRADELLNAVTAGLGYLATNGRPGPYALVLGGRLYVDAYSLLPGGSVETPEHKLAARISHLTVSGALPDESGVLVSLAGDPVMIYAAHDAITYFTGETFTATDGPFYTFRVYERIQFAVRDDRAIVSLRR